MSYGAALKEKGLLLLLLFSSFRPLSVAASPTVMKMTAFPRLADRRVKRNSVIVCFLLIFTLCFLQFDFSQVSTNKWDPSPRPLVKPEGVIVSGLVFYGRRDRVSCMKCYIEKNLVDNGGWLDEVLWIVNTNNDDDLAYLDEITATNPNRHKRVVITGDKLATYTYFKAWQHIERGKYYVKIDDDVLWIHDDAIPQMVTHKINNPHTFVVSANIINNPPLSFIHWHLGAIHPYFPDTNQPAEIDSNATRSWRPSEDGFWNGAENYEWPLDRAPPHRGHRWLRVENDGMLPQTPISKSMYEVWGDSYKSWAIAAQAHYSLLENIEKDALNLYKFERPWHMDGQRIRINFMVVNGDDIVDTDPENWTKGRGDEDMIVLDLPKKLRRPVVILGSALGAHFQFADQRDLSQTDLLARYRALAKETACLEETKMADWE